MNEYEFTLKFSLADSSIDAGIYVEQLGEAGCDDAVIGMGQKGRIALQFMRQAESAVSAIISAIRDVKSVIPEAKLIEATPDLVGLTDIADILGFSRQNMRKLMLAHLQTFPAPVHAGKAAIWHLSNVLQWVEAKQHKHIEPSMIEVAQANMQVNIAKENVHLNQQVLSQLSGLVS